MLEVAVFEIVGKNFYPASRMVWSLLETLVGLEISECEMSMLSKVTEVNRTCVRYS